jgi:hypothetical protein
VLERQAGGCRPWAAAAEQGSAAAALPDGSTTGKLGPARTRADPARPGAGMPDHQPQAPSPPGRLQSLIQPGRKDEQASPSKGEPR